MANDPTILGSVANGWRTVFDYSSGAGDSVRIRVSMGPYINLDSQIATLRAALDVQSLDPSVSPGSAIATIRCTYKSIPDGGFGLGERRSPVYAITPVMRMMDLRSHPYAQTLAADIPTIERYIADGDIVGLKTKYTGNANALGFAAHWVAGVTSYEQASFQLTITRYYTSPPSISADYTSINKVYAWAAIKTDGKGIPSYVDEPQYQTETGDAAGFEWRLVSVAPVIERHSENVVTWIYIGIYSWAKALYKGGSWVPTPL
jgi:hypothetical protein